MLTLWQTFAMVRTARPMGPHNSQSNCANATYPMPLAEFLHHLAKALVQQASASPTNQMASEAKKEGPRCEGWKHGNFMCTTMLTTGRSPGRNVCNCVFTKENVI